MTLQAFTSIDGAGGVNTVNAVLNGSVTPFELLNIQNVYATTSNEATLGLTNATSLTDLGNVGSSAKLTVTGLAASAVNLSVQNPNAGTDTVFAYASTTGTQSVNLRVDGLATGGAGPTASEVTINGIETINVTTDKHASTFTLNADAAKTVNIAGNQDLTLAGATVATLIDGTNFTGNLATALGVAGTLIGGSGNDTLATKSDAAGTVSGGLGNDTITGGSANDSLNGGAGNDTIIVTDLGVSSGVVTDTIDGGTGTADVLVTYSASAMAVSAAGTPTTYKITNIEQLTINDQFDNSTSGSLTLANVGVGINTLNLTLASTTLELTQDAESVTGAAGNLTINLGGNIASNTSALAGTFTVTDTGTATTDALTLNNLATAGTANINVFAGNAVTSTGYETVNINTGAGTNVSGGQTVSTLTVTADAAAANVAVNVTGTNAIDFNTAIATNSTGVLSINASGMTAQATGTTFDVATVTMGSSVGTISITGSEGVDLIGDSGLVLSNLATTVVAGAGNDKIYTGSAADSLDGGTGTDTLHGGSGNDTIKGGAGNDTITVGAGTVSVDGGADDDTINTTSANLTSVDTIDGGAGNDTLALDAAVTSPAAGNRVTNVEYLSYSGTGALTQDLSVFGSTTVTKVTSASNAAVVINNAAVAFNTVVLSDAGADSLAYDRANGSDTITNASTVAFTYAGATTIGSVTANYEETITLSTVADTVLTVTDLAADQLKTLNISGLGNTTISNAITGANDSLSAITTTQTGAATLKVDASLSTVNLTFTGGTSTGNNSITSGSGNDVMTAGTGALIAVLGAGADLATGGAGADNLSGDAGNDTLIGGSGADTLVGGTGADSIDGGTGVADYFSAAGMSGVTDGGAVTTSGAVVNLSGATLVAADITTATGGLYTANNGAGNINIATGQAAYLGSTGNNLSLNVDTLTNIENVIGSGGTDYIVTSATATIVDGGAGVDTIVGGAGADTITGGTGADLITTDAGDTLIVTAANQSNRAGYDSYSGLVDADVATTTFTFKNQGTEVGVTAGKLTATATVLTGAATLADAINLLLAGDGTTNAIVAWGQYGGNTYLAEDLGAAAGDTDIVVKIVGAVDLLAGADLNVTFA